MNAQPRKQKLELLDHRPASQQPPLAQPEHSKKNYTSFKPPGVKIDDPYYVPIGKEINFCELTFKALSIEALYLKKEVNIRSCFNLNDQWKGFFMTP
jgi:hypothetical protein